MQSIIVSASDRHPMTPYEPITLDKESVAVSQLENAIELWRQDGDPASIHTLAAAANVVFDALGKRVNAPSFIREYLRGASRAEHDLFNKAEVFFKHAARDLNDVLDYDRMQAEMLILDCICVYEEMHEEGKSLPMLLFLLYFSLHHPRYFPELWERPVPKGLEPENLARLSRAEFFAKVDQIFRESES
jgi:hypothetical protein